MRSSRLRWNKWSISAAIVVSVLGSRWVAHIAADHALGSSAATTRLFAETLVVTALFGLLLWRGVIVPVQRRHAIERVALSTAPITVAPRALALIDVTAVEDRGEGAITRGHLRLVPNPRVG